MPARFGAPLGVRIRSAQSVAIFEPVLGLDASQPSVDAPLGSTPASDNYVFRDGALEPRPMLSLRGASPQALGATPILGAHELVSVTNTRFPILSSTTRWEVYNQSGTPNGWSVLSYVSSYGIDSPPALASSEYWDFAQVYQAERDENIAIGAPGSYQTLYCTQSDTTVFSVLTGAPRAKFVTSLNDYVVTFNEREGASDFVQRVRWNDRGSASSWTGGLAGFEDLLSMKGQGTRVMTQDNQLVLFSDEEIWRGVQRDYPFTWAFGQLDASRGCPYSWTIAQTPLGLIFLGKDYQVYLLPKGGGASQPIGQRLHRQIRTTIDRPERAWAAYDNTHSRYQLYYPIRGGSGYPQRAAYLDINSGSWAPQSFDRLSGGISLSRGVEVTLTSSATTWGGLQAAGITWANLNMSWAELAGTSEERAILAGSSVGTAYYFNSNATSDNGTPAESRWLSSGLAGAEPSKQKTLTEFRVDYQGDSSSSLSVRFTPNTGGSFAGEVRVNLPAVSGISQAIAYPYIAGRYPAFEVSSEGQRYRLFRFHVTYREGGR